jgi:hypothetical protein
LYICDLNIFKPREIQALRHVEKEVINHVLEKGAAKNGLKINPN